MFTGIISAIGTIEKARDLPEGRSFRVVSPYDTATIDLGASIAHDGVCLTVTDKGEGWHEVEAWEEALRLTTVGTWGQGTRVNLERPLKMSDELGGHLVAGHVDGMADVVSVKDEGDATRFTLRAPSPLHPRKAQASIFVPRRSAPSKLVSKKTERCSSRSRSAAPAKALFSKTARSPRAPRRSAPSSV